MTPGTPEPGAKPDDDANDPLKAARRFVGGQVRDDYAAAVGARITAALTSPTPFAERLTHFWANHFAVSADKLQVIGLSGLLEFEAIRPNLMGKFGDMLNAVERHPAMLLYLDQAQSVGPNSMAGQFAANRPRANGQKLGPQRESRARDHGAAHARRAHRLYPGRRHRIRARADRLDGARDRARPGARLAGTDGTPGEFVFAERIHEPGERTIVGRKYAEGGETPGAGGARYARGQPGDRRACLDQARAPFRRRHAAARAGRAAQGVVSSRPAAICRRSTGR